MLDPTPFRHTRTWQHASLSHWFTPARTPPVSRILAVRPPREASCCKLSSGVPGPDWSMKASYCQRGVGQSTGCGQTIAMGKTTLFYSALSALQFGCRSFQQYCDLSRQYDPTPFGAKSSSGTVVQNYTGPGVDTFLHDFNRKDLLKYST